jgi:energy-coupling factor transporter ATP-binding protein EcfA2
MAVEAPVPPLIEIRGVSKSYRRGNQRIPVLQGIDLDIAEREFLALMGPSGSGKSTLLNLIAGIDRADAGSIKVADPMALIKAREALKRKYITSYEEPDFRQWSRIGGLAKPLTQAPIPTEDRRPQACQGCVNGCRSRSNLGYGNESACQETFWYNEFAQKVAKTP